MSRPRSQRAVGVDYIAQLTGYSTSTIYHWKAAGFLPPPNARRGRQGRVVWRRDRIDQWFEEKFEQP